MQASLSTPQYGLNKGLKVFGKAAYDAVVKELSENLFNRGAVEMVLNPTHQIYEMSLIYIMLLKQKQNGDIKGRGVGDGRGQR